MIRKRNGIMRLLAAARSDAEKLRRLNLLLGLLLLLLAFALASLGLQILIVDRESLVDLGAEGSIILETG
jgi:hypothetical protein